MSNYISLYNEVNGDFNTLVVDDLTVTNLTVDNIDVKTANVNTAIIQNATITDEKVTNSEIDNLSLNNKLLLPDGNNLNPSLTFINDTELGFYRSNLGEITFVYNGNPTFKINPSITNLYSNLFTDNRIILNDFTATAIAPTLQFFDIGLGIYRSNPDILSICSQGFTIIDITDLKLKVYGDIEAINMILSGGITSSGGFLSRLGNATTYSYGFIGLPTTFIYATNFPSITIQAGAQGCIECVPTQVTIFKPLACGTNSITCGPITSSTINCTSLTASAGVISRLGNSTTLSYGFSGLTNTFIYATANPNIVIQISGVAALDIGVGSILIQKPVILVNQPLTCSSLTCTVSATIPSLTGTTASITNLTCTSSTTTTLNCTTGTVTNLTSTTITNSGTMSSGNTTINGTQRISGITRIGTATPNTNSTNSLDVYGNQIIGIGGVSAAYAYNCYFSGGWRPITNGYSGYIRLDGGGGGISIAQTNTTNFADTLIPNLNNMMVISINGNIQFFGNVDTTSLSLSAQPMLVREMNASQSIPNNTNTTITTWNNVIVNQGSGISYAGGIFTLTTAGTYSFGYQVVFASNVTGFRESWVVNATTGKTYAGVCTNATSRRMLLSGSITLKVAANDQIALNVYQNSGAALNIDTTLGDTCSFTILRLN